MKDDRLNITFITEHINRIQTYTQGGKSIFMQSTLIQDAVIRNFEVVGEATKNLSDDLKLKYPNLPWRKVAGFRDVLIHGYINIDLDTIWDIIEQELPNLKAGVERIRQVLEDER